MKILIQENAEYAALKAAELTKQIINETLASKPVVSIAFSGGATPVQMLQHLSKMDIDWRQIHIFQVDERIAPAGDPARNLVSLEKYLIDCIPLPVGQIHAMPVESGDLQIATHNYADQIMEIAGSPPQLDIVHLGLGDDGHTASLPPGDDVLNSRREVDICAEFNGYQRMTMTYPVLDHARHILWLVTGHSKRTMLQRLLAADMRIPAGRVAQENAIVFADKDAAGEM